MATIERRFFQLEGNEAHEKASRWGRNYNHLPEDDAGKSSRTRKTIFRGISRGSGRRIIFIDRRRSRSY